MSDQPRIVYAIAPKRARKRKPSVTLTGPRIVTIRKILPSERDHPEPNDAVKDLVRRMMRPPGS